MKVPVVTRRLVLMSSGLLFSIFPTISGPRSPTTTKNAMQVPRRKPIMKSSTKNFPVLPKAWNAKNSKFLRRDITADFMRKWQASLDSVLLSRSTRAASTMPHCLKQNGIANTLTPITLFARVITCERWGIIFIIFYLLVNIYFIFVYKNYCCCCCCFFFMVIIFVESRLGAWSQKSLVFHCFLFITFAYK